MTDHGRHVVAFAGQRVVVEWHGAAAAPVVALLGPNDDVDTKICAGTDDGRSAPVTLHLSVADTADGTVVALDRDNVALYRGSSVGTAAHQLLQHALYHLIDRSDGGLVLHAALVGMGENGVVLPGPSGSGKSMLAAWMARHGARPLSDEACFLPDDICQATPFPRAFCFKGSWADVLGASDAVESFRSGDVRMVLREQVSSTGTVGIGSAPDAPVEPRLLVFPHFERNTPFELSPMRPARAAMRLFETLANARNLSDHGVAAVAGLARSIPAFDLVYGHVDQLAPFRQLLARETEDHLA